MTDRVQRLREAAQARHNATLRRAERALTHLADLGQPVTYRRVATTAGVSRSWLYQQPGLREQIDRLRERPPAGARSGIPSTEQATLDSLRQQLHTYREEITRLQSENRTLRQQLARRLGTERTAAITRGT